MKDVSCLNSFEDPTEDDIKKLINELHTKSSELETTSVVLKHLKKNIEYYLFKLYLTVDYHEIVLYYVYKRELMHCINVAGNP